MWCASTKRIKRWRRLVVQITYRNRAWQGATGTKKKMLTWRMTQTMFWTYGMGSWNMRGAGEVILLLQSQEVV
ncbi:hypothetical protein CsSME_00007348 [Camellia sinensis var. sinensis]